MVHAHLRCSSPAGVWWPALQSSIYVRCRRCEGCLRLRQYSWMARAAHEQAFAQRTWFVTLTYGPDHRAAIMRSASQAKSGKPTSKRLITASGRYVSGLCKTLRKRGFEFRYIFCPELHQNGFPHWHGLIHCDDELKWAHLTSAWSAGFSVVKLVRDANALKYVTKYLSKYKLGRVRASLHYGDPAGLHVGATPRHFAKQRRGVIPSLRPQTQKIVEPT